MSCAESVFLCTLPSPQHRSAISLVISPSQEHALVPSLFWVTSILRAGALVGSSFGMSESFGLLGPLSSPLPSHSVVCLRLTPPHASSACLTTQMGFSKPPPASCRVPLAWLALLARPCLTVGCPLGMISSALLLSPRTRQVFDLCSWPLRNTMPTLGRQCHAQPALPTCELLAQMPALGKSAKLHPLHSPNPFRLVQATSTWRPRWCSHWFHLPPHAQLQDSRLAGEEGSQVPAQPGVGPLGTHLRTDLCPHIPSAASTSK